MIPAAYEEYKIQIQGLFFTGALIGVIFAEIFCSGSLSDLIVTRLARKNHGIRTPEMRLWLGYPGAILSAIGLAVSGASVQLGWHWIVGQVALFLFAVGLQAGNTTLSTYIVDSYPEHAIEVITFYSVIINVSSNWLWRMRIIHTDQTQMSAFIVPWYIFDWTAAVGKLFAHIRRTLDADASCFRVWVVFWHAGDHLCRLSPINIFRTSQMGTKMGQADSSDV